MEGYAGYHCVDAVRSAKRLPVECESDSECISSNGRDIGRCECGYNSEGKSYCTLFGGDELYMNYLRKNKEWHSTGLGQNCNLLQYLKLTVLRAIGMKITIKNGSIIIR